LRHSSAVCRLVFASSRSHGGTPFRFLFNSCPRFITSFPSRLTKEIVHRSSVFVTNPRFLNGVVGFSDCGCCSVRSLHTRFFLPTVCTNVFRSFLWSEGESIVVCVLTNHLKTAYDWCNPFISTEIVSRRFLLRLESYVFCSWLARNVDGLGRRSSRFKYQSVT
jgi:hypothetical protein